MRCRGDQVAIAAVDLAEFRLQRTGQVQGIGRAEEHVRRQEGHPSRLRLHHCGSYRQGRPQAGVEIGFDLGGELPELPLRQALSRKWRWNVAITSPRPTEQHASPSEASA